MFRLLGAGVRALIGDAGVSADDLLGSQSHCLIFHGQALEMTFFLTCIGTHISMGKVPRQLVQKPAMSCTWNFKLRPITQ